MAGWATAALDQMGMKEGPPKRKASSLIGESVSRSPSFTSALSNGFDVPRASSLMDGGFSAQRFTPASQLLGQPASRAMSASSFLAPSSRIGAASSLLGTSGQSFGSRVSKASDLLGGTGRIGRASDLLAPAFDSGGMGQGVAQQVGQQAAGAVGAAGGKWSALDKYDSMFNAAASEFGVDAKLLKSMAYIESGGVGHFNADGSVLTRVSDGYGDGPTVGIMQVKPQLWGNLVPGANAYTAEGNIRIGAALMAQSIRQHGSWQKALTTVYFPANDPNGTTQNMYVQRVTQYMNELDTGGTPITQVGGKPVIGSVKGNANTQSVLAAAQQYLGTPYVWGAIPGKGANPRATGWDCSGFVYWLDQNYGSGTVPMGSHYQYDWAAKNGALKRDPSQLQAGDMIFFDTGGRDGGGANLNGASHVGIYLGNNQFMHAANPTDGTIISNFTHYTQMYPYLGGASMSFSGGAAGAVGAGVAGMVGGGQTGGNAGYGTGYGGFMSRALAILGGQY